MKLKLKLKTKTKTGSMNIAWDQRCWEGSSKSMFLMQLFRQEMSKPLYYRVKQPISTQNQTKQCL